MLFRSGPSNLVWESEGGRFAHNGEALYIDSPGVVTPVNYKVQLEQPVQRYLYADAGIFVAREVYVF